ncbi:unnamed protein product [Caenorhabditis brenneri]
MPSTTQSPLTKLCNKSTYTEASAGNNKMSFLYLFLSLKIAEVHNYRRRGSTPRQMNQPARWVSRQTASSFPRLPASDLPYECEGSTTF